MNNSHNFSFLIDTDSEEAQQHVAFEKGGSKFEKEICNQIHTEQDTLLKPLFSRERIES